MSAVADQKEDSPGDNQADAGATAAAGSAAGAATRTRSKNFHLTRILLKAVASMAEAGEISLQQKGFLKDLIVDQDGGVLGIAERFDTENDYTEFKEQLIRIASRRADE